MFYSLKIASRLEIPMNLNINYEREGRQFLCKLDQYSEEKQDNWKGNKRRIIDYKKEHMKMY